LDALVNNAAIFEPLTWDTTDLESWQRHQNINLTAPFMLSQAFARQLPSGNPGRIVNILDWRALRPGADHLPYTISKAGLAALTKSLALALAPNIQVNGIAFGAVLPPSDAGDTSKVIQKVPAQRWAHMEEVIDTLLFLLAGPDYVTGEIIHLDGGRHLV
jgi:NAD(P)-dependent dehydrogenase (short-subunit alcohol dehydrogenase family)